MTTPDLLTLIRRACEGTAAEGLAPKIMDLPVCVATCRHFTGPWCDIDRGAVCEPAVEALARLAVSQAAEVERLNKDLAIASADLAVARAVDAEHLARAVRAEREVERLAEALRVATVSPPLPSNGCEPAAVEGVELVWFRDRFARSWHLCLPAEVGRLHAPYDAYSGTACSFLYKGAARERSAMTADQPEACRQIAEWARADGYRVPPHPLGWDVGGDL